MDIFEYSEVTYPSRTIQQDEEEAAEATAHSNLELPLTLWNAELRSQLFNSGIVVDVMVIATTRASCALLNQVLPDKQLLGSVVLPEASMRGLTLPHSLRNRTCTIHVTSPPSVPAPVLLVSCQYDVPPERAHALCTALMGEVCPQQVVVLGCLRAEAYRGGGDPSQESLVFRLPTSNQATQPAKPCPVPVLPTGNVVGGLPAAVVSYCQVRGVACELVVDVEMVPSLCAESVAPLAAATAAVLAHAPCSHTPPAAGTAQPSAPPPLAAVCSAVAAAVSARQAVAAAAREMEVAMASVTGSLGAVYA